MYLLNFTLKRNFFRDFNRIVVFKKNQLLIYSFLPQL